MRWTSHLDLALAWERLLRRARMPVIYSKGFNPRPKINLAAALPLGYVSSCELVDVWLETAVEPAVALDQLLATTPPGISLLSIVEVDPTEKKLQAQLISAKYRVDLDKRTGLDDDLGQAVSELLTAQHINRERRGKAYDLRPLIEHLALSGDGHGLHMRLAARPGATGRPDEVLEELGVDSTQVVIRRTRLVLSTP